MCMYVHVCVSVCVRVYAHHNFFIHLSTDGYLGCFHVLALINNAAMKVGAQVSFQINVFISLGYIPEVPQQGYCALTFLILYRCLESASGQS